MTITASYISHPQHFSLSIWYFFFILLKPFRIHLGPSLFKGAVASFCNINFIKIALLYTKKIMTQICRFCNSFLSNQFSRPLYQDIEVSTEVCVYFSNSHVHDLVLRRAFKSWTKRPFYRYGGHIELIRFKDVRM